jgi:hypothetical protein
VIGFGFGGQKTNNSAIEHFRPYLGVRFTQIHHTFNWKNAEYLFVRVLIRKWRKLQTHIME